MQLVWWSNFTSSDVPVQAKASICHRTGANTCSESRIFFMAQGELRVLDHATPISFGGLLWIISLKLQVLLR